MLLYIVLLRHDVLKEQRFCGIDKDRDDAHAIIIINQQTFGGVIRQTSEKCIDCGRRTSRNLRYCDVCRKAHFISALRNIRHESVSKSVIRPSVSKPSRRGATNLKHEQGIEFAKKTEYSDITPQKSPQRAVVLPRI